MATAFYRNGVVTVTKGSKVVTGNHTTWTGGATKPLPGDVFVFNNKLYEVEVIVSDTELTLYREFEDDTQVDQEYVIMRNASLNISSRIAAAVAIAINQKQQQLDEFNNFLTNTTDPTVEFTDTLGNKVTVIPIPELEREIAEMIDNTSNIANLVQQAIDAKDGAVAAESNVTTMRNEVTQMKAEVTSMHDDVETWQQEVSDTKDDIDAKYLQINSWHTETGELKDDAEAAAVKAEAAAQSVSDLEWKQYCQPQANMLANRLLVNNEFAASGMVHSGKHNLDAINEGLWVDISIPNKVFLGGGLNGTSETAHAVMNIAGALCEITTNWTFEDPSSSPDIANRVDMFGIELKELPVTDKVYPLGDLSVTPVDWETANKKEFVSNPYNNIFLMPDGSLIQLCWFARVVTGTRNGDWSNLWPSQGSLQYDNGVVFEGYSDTSNVGVFKHESEEQYFYVCGRVPRLNNAAYNNQNFMGAYRFSDNQFWYNTGADSLTLEDAFLNVSSNKDTSGRTDGKRAQFIYPSGQGGIIDYRLPARDMGAPEDGAKVFQKVVNGTYRGEEQLAETRVFVATLQSGGTTYGQVHITESDMSKIVAWSGTYGFSSGIASCMLYNPTTGKFISGNYIPESGAPRIVSSLDPETGTTAFIRDDGLEIGKLFNSRSTSLASGGGSGSADTSSFGVAGQTVYVMVSRLSDVTVSGEFSLVDVVGNPANILATSQLANGWLGGWIPQIPDGTVSTWELTRKLIGSAIASREYTSDNGVSWQTTSSTNFDATINSIYNSPYSAPSVLVINYTAFAKQTKPSTKKTVFNGDNGVGRVWAHGGYINTAWGNLLVESLLGKVGTNSSSLALHQSLGLKHFAIQGSNKWIDDGNSRLPIHDPVGLGTPDNDSPAVKALWHQVSTNQQATLSFLWNELVWKDFSGQTINVVSNQQSVTCSTYEIVRFNDPSGTLFGSIYIRQGSNLSGANLSGQCVLADGKVVGTSGAETGNDFWTPFMGNGWGDDSKIHIIDGTGTYVNLNGDTCLYGSAELAIPYGYTKNQARAGSQVPGVDL